MFIVGLLKLFTLVGCDVFILKPNEEFKVFMHLDDENITSGYFKGYDENASFDVKILAGNNDEKTFYTETLTGKAPKHFSFNTSKPEIITIIMKSLNQTSDHKIYLKFETKLNTFNSKIANDFQIKPAIYAMTQITSQINKTISSSREVSMNSENVGNLYRKIIKVMFVLSCICVTLYFGLFTFQVFSLKNYFRRKKML